jgi:outer membrane receptor protein involved in Fe transport
VGLRYDYFIFDVEDYLPTDSTHKNYTGYNYQTAFNPKFNLIYTATDKLQFFFNAGSGYHSNDARAVVQDKYRHNLPRAVSAEIGTLFYIKRVAVSAALWAMDLNNELVYSGDDGTTHNRGSSRRYGVDVSVRAPLTKWFFVDADLNYSKSRYINTLFGTQLKTDYYIPLAPTLTSAGGITTKFKNFEFSFRYRYMHDRPASSDGTIVAHGYTVFDFTANYKVKRYKIGLVIENLFNTKWNEAQFETESRLKEETKPIDELNFTPGTPFYIKLMVGYLF